MYLEIKQDNILHCGTFMQPLLESKSNNITCSKCVSLALVMFFLSKLLTITTQCLSYETCADFMGSFRRFMLSFNCLLVLLVTLFCSLPPPPKKIKSHICIKIPKLFRWNFSIISGLSVVLLRFDSWRRQLLFSLSAS